jgi:signal transduction histidine kinase
MTVYLLLPLIQALISMVLIGVVLKGHLRSFIHRLFSLFLLTLVFWGICIFGMRGSPDIEHAYLWERCLIPVAAFMVVLFYHFSIHCTDNKTRRLTLPLLYGICLLFIPFAATDFVIRGMQVKPFGYAPIPGPVAPLWFLFTYGILVAALVVFIRSYRKSSYAEQRNRFAYIIAGLSVTFAGAVFDILPILGLPLYPGSIFGNIVFCLLATVAIVRYNLLDIRVVIRKGTAYVLTSAVIAIPFVGMFLLATKVFTEGDFPSWVYFIVAIMLALFLPQLWQWFQRRVDRWFYRDRYDYLKALETFSHQTQSITDSDRLGSTMVNLLVKALRSSNVYFLQPLSNNHDFTTVFPTGVNNPASDICLRRRGALVKWLERSQSMLLYEDIEIIPQLQGVTSKERQSLQKVGAELIVPLNAPTGRLSGILIMGKKLSEQHYTVEDKGLIYTICNQMSTNLENARLYSESQQEVEERKRAQEEEKRLQQELYLSSRLASVGELAAGVAHEINNPLTGIVGFSQRLLRKSTDEEASQDLEIMLRDLGIIHNEAQRAAKVVENLLTFARRHQPKKQYSDVNEILQSALELRAYELRTSNIEVVTDLAPSLPQIMVDFHQIQEVFLNIILNAEQVMTEARGGGRLTIKTEEEKKGYTRTTFTDNGPGIPAEHLVKIFDPFFTTRGEGGGTGLGLSACHGIVTEHGGRIYAKSKPGKGATFFVELPISTEMIAKG